MNTVATAPPDSGWLCIAGLGPGDERLVTPEVSDALWEATDVVGYIPYVARVGARPGLTLHASDNRVEMDRARFALGLAAAGLGFGFGLVSINRIISGE